MNTAGADWQLAPVDAEALKDPRVREGARIEAEYQRRVAGVHRQLVEYVQVLAETGQDETDAALAFMALWVFGGGESWRTRVRWAWRLLRPC